RIVPTVVVVGPYCVQIDSGVAWNQPQDSGPGGLVVMSGPKYDGHYTIPLDQYRDHKAVVAALQWMADVYGSERENTFIVSRVYRVWGNDSCDVYWKEDGSLLTLRLPVRADHETCARAYEDRVQLTGTAPSGSEETP